MSQMQQTAPRPKQGPAKLLDQANQVVSPLAAGEFGGLPPSAQSALQSAQGSLTSGSAQAASGQNGPAQSSANAAALALAQAQAALALAQAGLNSESAMASNGQGGQGKNQGQGNGQGQGQGQGKGQAQGPGQGKGAPGKQGSGRQGNWDGPGGADGPRQGTSGSGQFTGLPMRDRAAIQQSQGEKYPQEYGPLVEQYLKNLSDQSDRDK